MKRTLVSLCLALPLTLTASAASAGATGSPPVHESGQAAAKPTKFFVTVAEIVREKPADTLRTKGCWKLAKADPTKRAKVKVWIERRSPGSDTWNRVSGSTTKTIKSGCTQKTIHTKSCDTSSKTYEYRSRVDVDIVGAIDTPDVAASPAREIKCFAA
ncbi:hypothetical protein [Nocardioides daphniae]|nr:hypothetical protein [Nocardioides daphniae]QCC78524.1 hypothetical protein E2C04_17345 [Nocardioides daphniae]